MHQPSIRIDHIGHERQPVVIVDDFSPHPDHLVAEACTRDFKVMGPYYPGVRAPVSSLYFEGLAATLNPVMRDVFGAHTNVAFDRALYSLATTPPADLGLAQRIPHVDGVKPGTMAIIHYLSHHDQCGTAFFRQRSTGFETVTAERHRQYLDSLQADIDRHGEPAAAYVSGDTPLFEQIATYGSVFNRALIYRGNLLHCACLKDELALTKSPESGRLTVASFLTIA